MCALTPVHVQLVQYTGSWGQNKIWEPGIPVSLDCCTCSVDLLLLWESLSMYTHTRYIQYMYSWYSLHRMMGLRWDLNARYPSFFRLLVCCYCCCSLPQAVSTEDHSVSVCTHTCTCCTSTGTVHRVRGLSETKLNVRPFPILPCHVGSRTPSSEDFTSPFGE